MDQEINEDAKISSALANKARSALTWCIEEIGKVAIEQEAMNPDHLKKIEEIHHLIAELANSIYAEKEKASQTCMPVQEMAFKLSDGREFKVRRL